MNLPCAQTLDHFELTQPVFNYLCTCKLARCVWPKLPNYKIDTLAAHVGFDFRHHHAQADAEAAGRVMLAMMEHLRATSLG